MTDKSAPKPTYDIGYGKPPKHSQFKPGQSGNPKGRRKGVQNLRTDVMAVLRMPVVITENGKKKKISSQAGSILKLREKALHGDDRALVRLLELAARYNDEPSPPAADAPLSADDKEILADFLARHSGGRGAPDQPDGDSSNEETDDSASTERSADAASPTPDAPPSSEDSRDVDSDDPPSSDPADGERK